MRNNNVCKFIAPKTDTPLTVHHFVKETDATVSTSAHILANHVALLAVSEEGFFSLDGVPYPLRAGHLYFGFRGETFAFSGARTVEYLYIGFEGRRADELFARFGICPTARVAEGCKALIPFWRDALSRGTPANLDLVSESALLYAFSLLERNETSSDEVMRRVLYLLEEQFSDKELSLSSVAAEVGYHEKYLSHRFRLYTGVGFNRYLKNLRVKNAVFLMDNGVRSVKNVALLCGFGDPLYFSKVFRLEMGLSPSDYLRKKEG
jgi:AraC-like DNA-binding protein